MALLTNDNKSMQTNIDLLQKFCFCYGLEINYDSRDKSTYTTNEEGDHKIFIRQLQCMTGQYDFFGVQYNKTELLITKKEDTYKYLGIYINLQLDWGVQQTISRKKLLRQNFYLRNKCFNTTQTIDAINKVFLPAATYKMNVIDFGRSWYLEIDNLHI